MAELYAPATGSIKQEKISGLHQEPAILHLVSSFDTEVITTGEIQLCHWIVGDLGPGIHLFGVFFCSKSDFHLPSHPFPATCHGNQWVSQLHCEHHNEVSQILLLSHPWGFHSGSGPCPGCRTLRWRQELNPDAKHHFPIQRVSALSLPRDK